MDAISLHDLAQACGGKLLQGSGDGAVTRLSKDTRTLQVGDLYWALRGENFDGNDFVAAAATAGAAGAVIEKKSEGLPQNFPLIEVADAGVALHQLAHWYRARLHARVVAITGSNGKTSTKDFLASIAATRFAVNRTEGNLNNHIGLPLTILSAKATDEVAIWEIGMNHPGEIAQLARLAQPAMGIITHIGVAHIEFLGSREAIAREKGALAEILPKDGVLVLPSWDEFSSVLAARTEARVCEAGTMQSVYAENIRPASGGFDFDLVSGRERVAAHLPVPGEHMIRNALLAVTAAQELGISLRECASGLAATRLSSRRLACLEVRGVMVLDDSYNANPDSMEAALHALHGLPGGGRRFALLGRMGELGGYAAEGYRRVGRAAAATVHVVIAVGPETEDLAAAAEAAGTVEVRRVADTDAAGNLLREMARPGDAVVIKGSRSARMERVLEVFS